MSEPRYYSQHGEDFLLEKLFPGKRDGFFVEIGCIDGKRFSNTLFFEELGWKGLCVEAHAGYIEMIRKNRPRAIVEHAAAGEKDQAAVEFFANSRGTLSTLDKTKEREFAENFGEYFTGFEVQKTPMLTLATILKKHGITEVDAVSLDIEGYEVPALRGVDFSAVKPKVFVIETDSSEQIAQIEAILSPGGYHFVAEVSKNRFYSVKKSDADLIGNKAFKGVKLTHTQHPLDKGGDTIETVDVVTGKSFGSRIKSAPGLGRK